MEYGKASWYGKDFHGRPTSPNDLLTVGTVCKMVQLVKLPNKGTKILVEGLSRVFLHNVTLESPYYRADIQEVVEPHEETPLTETLVQSIGTLFKASLALGKPLSDEVLKSLDSLDHPGRLADLMALTLHLGIKDQQEILEMIDPLDRLKKVFHLFSREIQSSSLKPRPFFHSSREGAKSLKDLPSRGPLKGQRDLPEDDPGLTSDGQWLAFMSAAANLIPGDTNDTTDVFVRERASGQIVCASVDSSGIQGNDLSYFPVLPAGGAAVAFVSIATNLDPGDTNNIWDVYLRELGGGGVVTYCSASNTSIPGCKAAISASGIPSASNPTGFTVSSGLVPGSKYGIAYLGVNGAAAIPFGTQGGFLCVALAGLPRPGQGLEAPTGCASVSSSTTSRSSPATALTALRTPQLKDGARPRLPPGNHKLVWVALGEARAGLLSWESLPAVGAEVRG